MDDPSPSRDTNQDVEPQGRAIAREAAKKFAADVLAYTRYRAKLDAAYAEIDDRCGEDRPLRIRERRCARQDLADDHTLRTKPAAIAIATQTGTGKTTAVLKALVDLGISTDVYLPKADQCAEKARDFGEYGGLGMYEAPRNGMDADYVRGSPFDDEVIASEEHARSKGHAGMQCPRFERAKVLSDAGINVEKKLCQQCTLSHWCGYRRQAGEMELLRDQGGAIFRTQARIHLGDRVERATVHVIDESLMKACMKAIVIKRSDIEWVGIWRLMSGSRANDQDAIKRACRLIADVVSDITMVERYRKDGHRQRPVSELAEGEQVKDVAYLHALLGREIKAREASIEAMKGSAENLHAVVEASGVKFMRDFQILCRHVVYAGNNEGCAATLSVNEIKVDELTYQVVNVAHVELPKFKKEDNIMVMDASLNKDYLSILFPKHSFDLYHDDPDISNIEVHHDDIGATRSTLAQYDGEAKKWVGNDALRDLVKRAFDWIGADGRCGLIVANKAVRQAMLQSGWVPPGWDTATFSEAVATNKWEQFDGVAIIGQALPSVDVLEQRAAALAMASGDGEPIRMAEPNSHGGVTLLPVDGNGDYWHPDRRVWSLVEALVHESYVQAVGRVRANLSPRPKRIYLASNFVPRQMERGIVGAYTRGRKKLSTTDRAILGSIMGLGFAVLSPSTMAAKHTLGSKIFERELNKGGGKNNFEEYQKFLINNANYVLTQLSHGHIKKDSKFAVLEPKYCFQRESDKNEGLPKTQTLTYVYSVSMWDYPWRKSDWSSTRLGMFHVRWGARRRKAPVIFDTETTFEEMQAVAEIAGFGPLEIVPPEHENADRFTMLQVETDRGEIATKTFKRSTIDGSISPDQDYRAGTHFRWFEAACTGIEDLSAKLMDLERRSDLFVIRGEPKRYDGTVPTMIRRTMRGEGAMLVDRPRHWLMMDVDEFDVPYGVDDPETAAHALLRSLPEPFRSTTCHVSMSASCWLKDRSKFKAHLWFWLEEPMLSDQIRRWLQAGELFEQVGPKAFEGGDGDVRIDAAVFTGVQPHYTAAPIIAGGDPFPVRSWLVRGTLDEIPALKIPEQVRIDQAPDPERRMTDKDRARALPRFRWALQRLGAESGFNQPLMTAALHAMVAVDEGQIMQIEAIMDMQAAIYAADPGGRDRATIDHYANTDRLQRRIEWWREHYGQQRQE